MAWLIPVGLLALIVGEISVFAAAGRAFGVGTTVLLVIASALAGSALLRRQGEGLARRARGGLIIANEPLDGAIRQLCIGLAGVLLIIPGFITDAIAGLLLLPPLQRLITAWDRRHLRELGLAPRQGSGVIDGDYQVVEPTRPGPDIKVIDHDPPK